MKDRSSVVEEIIPGMYENIAQTQGYPMGYNLAGSNQCHVLSKGLYLALKTRNLESRREYHRLDDDTWHYVVAHTPEDAVPTEDDIITDLNPWQYLGQRAGNLSYLHGTRQEVMDILRAHEAPDYIVSLRGLATVAKAHHLDIGKRPEV